MIKIAGQIEDPHPIKQPECFAEVAMNDKPRRGF